MSKGALIVGATGGIGSALAKELRASDWDLVLVGRNEEKLVDLAGKLQVSYFVADACDLDQVQKLSQFTSENLKVFNGVVNCIGSIFLKPAHLVTESEFTSVLRQNLYTSFFLTKSTVPFLKEQGGSIVMFSSAATQIGLPNHEIICAAKAGIEGFVRGAAASYAANRIRINAISPGLVDTPLAEKITSNQKSLEHSTAMHPIGRIGKPLDIANAAAWLLEPENSWVTGQNFVIDGGLSGIKTH